MSTPIESSTGQAGPEAGSGGGPSDEHYHSDENPDMFQDMSDDSITPTQSTTQLINPALLEIEPTSNILPSPSPSPSPSPETSSSLDEIDRGFEPMIDDYRELAQSVRSNDTFASQPSSSSFVPTTTIETHLGTQQRHHLSIPPGSQLPLRTKCANIDEHTLQYVVQVADNLLSHYGIVTVTRMVLMDVITADESTRTCIIVEAISTAETYSAWNDAAFSISLVLLKHFGEKIGVEIYDPEEAASVYTDEITRDDSTIASFDKRYWQIAEAVETLLGTDWLQWGLYNVVEERKKEMRLHGKSLGCYEYDREYETAVVISLKPCVARCWSTVRHKLVEASGGIGVIFEIGRRFGGAGYRVRKMVLQ